MSADLLAAYDAAAEPAAALAALDAIAAVAATSPPPFDLAVEYDELAAELADDAAFALAARAQRQALDLGGDPDGRELLAWYLLRSGDRDEPERLFAALRAEREPTDPSTDLLAADCYLDCGLTEEGLAALDAAVATARHGAPDDLAEALVSRLEARRAFDREEDDDDRLAETLVSAPGPVTQPALAWFAPDQARLAAARWPEVADELADPVGHAKAVEADAREVTEVIGRRPAIVPVVLDAFVTWAQDAGVDPDEQGTLAEYAEARLRAGDGMAWPPGRNDPCWCGSGRKYKRCCGG